eukprot:GABV01000107.1.p3 GENE.GABV01000107.1~~GABV01000107.1.p3  ORF type:complete len:125 (+),score=33.47 GABV01000107.1:134-508(+)
MSISNGKTWSSDTWHFLVNKEDSIETVLFRLWLASDARREFAPSQVSFWKDLKDSGDGWRAGTKLDVHQQVRRYTFGRGFGGFGIASDSAESYQQLSGEIGQIATGELTVEGDKRHIDREERPF